MSPISLSDQELSQIMAASAPLPPPQRPRFMQAVADRLAVYPEASRGAGLVHRILVETQRKFFDPPLLGRHENRVNGFQRGRER